MNQDGPHGHGPEESAVILLPRRSEPPLATVVGTQLRNVRRQARLTLADVQRRSGGRWTASMLGSYERGECSVSMARVFMLSRFYDVPISTLVELAPPRRREIFLRRPVLDTRLLADSGVWPQVSALVRAVQQARGCEGSRLVELRARDLERVAFMHGLSHPALLAELDSAGFLARVANPYSAHGR